MSKSLETLRSTLATCEEALASAEAARDNWEPDCDNSDHTASLDASLDEQYQLPGALSHLSYAKLLFETDRSAYLEEFNNWEDGIRGERERRRTWSDFDELCDAVEEAESARDEAQEALDEAEEAAGE
jgi:chromosome segregation ATPase